MIRADVHASGALMTIATVAKTIKMDNSATDKMIRVLMQMYVIIKKLMPVLLFLEFPQGILVLSSAGCCNSRICGMSHRSAAYCASASAALRTN